MPPGMFGGIPGPPMGGPAGEPEGGKGGKGGMPRPPGAVAWSVKSSVNKGGSKRLRRIRRPAWSYVETLQVVVGRLPAQMEGAAYRLGKRRRVVEESLGLVRVEVRLVVQALDSRRLDLQLRRRR